MVIDEFHLVAVLLECLNHEILLESIYLNVYP